MSFLMDCPRNAAFLFAGWKEAIIWSCLQGMMGKVYADNLYRPKSPAAVLGDFHFFAGRPDKELILHEQEWHKRKFAIMIPRDNEWGSLIETCYRGKIKKVTRYAIKKERDVFSRSQLQQAVKKLPREYSMKRIDEEIYDWCQKHSWCRDWVAQYETYEIYRKNGLGVVILKDGSPVSGASSYATYRGGIEIEIDTKEEYRRKGLAYICAAKLILECLDRNLYPSWDAQNKGSVALAEKLGYHYDHAYTAYEVWI